MGKIALNIYELKKGDILLTSMTDELSVGIQKLIGSKFTHTSLYLGDAVFIEATLDGSNFFTPLHFLFDGIDSLKVLRLNYSDHEHIEKILSDIEYSAREFSFRQYAQLTAIKAGKLKEAELLSGATNDAVEILDGWEKSVHCSQLVALAYNIGGKISLISNKKPENVTPPDIESSNLLVDVTSLVTFEIEDDTDMEAKLYPQSPENSILTKQTFVSQQALKIIKLSEQKLGLTFPPDIGLVIQMLLTVEPDKAANLDKELNEILTKVEYYDLWSEYEQNYDQFNQDTIEIIKAKVDSGEINLENYQSYLDYFQFDILTTHNTISKQKWNLIASRNNFNNTQFDTHRELTKMYLNFLKFLTRIYGNQLDIFDCIVNSFEEKQ